MSIPDTRPPAILLAGPTASGKSSLALHLTERFPCEIISVDSAQVFRDMTIGTAKPSAAERSTVPHHLIDVISPEEAYSAARFCRDTAGLMCEISDRGKIPLLVGGTMLYIKALREGLAELPAADPALRAAIEAEAASHGWPALHAELSRLDPPTAARLAPNDKQRIQRALEVARGTGKPLSAWHAEAHQCTALPCRLLELALSVPDNAARLVLHQRIARRFEAMLADGLEDEVLMLRQRYRLRADMTSMRCVGYRQVWEVLEGTTPRSELRERGIYATRQLAKRQITWLRGMNWLTPFEFTDARATEKIVAAVAKFVG